MRRTRKADPETKPLRQELRSAMTSAESKLWSHLREEQFHGLKFRRQHGIGPFIVDFFCPERALVVEVDGGIHQEANQRVRDWERSQYLESLNVRVVRYKNEEILENIDGVLENLKEMIKSTPL